MQDKHAIVTGGSRGIGKAIARELAREGADVAIVARNKADLEATAQELAAETNRRIIPLAADVTSTEQVDRMVVEAAQQLGGLHILVNSGSAPGGSPAATGPIETVIDEDLLQDFNVKYVGALRCSRAVIPFIKTAGWGRIINISGGNVRNAGNLGGGARNAGLVHMTKTLAVQLGGRPKKRSDDPPPALQLPQVFRASTGRARRHNSASRDLRPRTRREPAAVAMLKTRGIALLNLGERIDTNSAAGVLVFHVFGAIAHFERRLVAERTKDGIAARVRGKRPGRQPLDPGKIAAAFELVKAGLSPTAAAKHLGLGRLTIHRKPGRAGIERTP